MSDLVERLLAAIEQREEIAKAARTTLWDDDADERRPVDGAWEVDYEGSVSEQLTLDSIAGCTRVDFEHTRLREGVAPHIAANDPASVLRLCQAHREIVELYRTECHMLDMGVGEWARGRTLALRDVVRALAGGYGIQEEDSDGR